MLDNFREWLSDNLRYILLGLAGILVLIIAFFAIRLITSVGTPKKEKQTEIETEENTEKQTEGVKDEHLVKDQPDILSFVTQYYTALANGDYDSIASYSKTFDDATKSELENNNSAIEACNNIIVYSRSGLTDGSYIVYVYFDAKITGIDTLVPTLRQLYLETAADGGYKIVDISLDENQDIENYTTQLLADDEVQALMKDVKMRYEDAVASDEQLQNFVVSSGSSNNNTSKGDDTQPEDTVNTTTGTMYASTDGLNVRGTPSTDGVVYGSLMTGTAVEVLENTDTGWSKIRYTVNGTTIEGYVKSEYLTTEQ